jgi:hypothetical protein
MPLPIRSTPYTNQGRENHDRIFRKPMTIDELVASPEWLAAAEETKKEFGLCTHAHTDPVHAITPGVIREYRSKCCGAEVNPDPALYGCPICSDCGKPCVQVLTRIN